MGSVCGPDYALVRLASALLSTRSRLYARTDAGRC